MHPKSIFFTALLLSKLSTIASTGAGAAVFKGEGRSTLTLTSTPTSTSTTELSDSFSDSHSESLSRSLKDDIHSRHQPGKETNNVESPKMTDEPTATPTISPIKSPVRRPTDRPTKRPTDPPTDRPTKRPTNPPTKRPTFAPVKKGDPTRAPIVSPTLSPVKSICEKNDGTFGSSGDKSTSKILVYYYEIKSSNDIATLVKELEGKMAEALIKSLDSSCEKTRLNRKSNRMLSVADIRGLSQDPPDSIMTNSCTNIEGDGCKVVQGKLTIHLTSTTMDDTTKDTIFEGIETFLDDTDANSDDTTVFYLKNAPTNSLLQEDSTPLTDGAGAAQPAQSSSFTLVTPVLASLACAFIVVGVYTGRRSLKIKRDEMRERNKYLDDDNSVVDDVALNSFGSDYNFRTAISVE